MPETTSTSLPNRAVWIIMGFLLGVGTLGAAWYSRSRIEPAVTTASNPAVADTTLHREPIELALGKVRSPLPYRIVSFHRGRADKRLIQLAHELGFNGVQIQIEGSTLTGLKDFAKYDAKEHLVDFCHGLNMQVTLWVHELSDVPQEDMPEALGPVKVDNDYLWQFLDTRYNWILGTLVPNIDGLCLTVVETQVRITDGPVLAKLTDVVRQACDRHHKSLIVRTFVWFPEEFKGVMNAVKQLPADTVLMSKCVPQDWNIRGINAAEIGDVGGRTQIEEYDACGEYWLRDHVANCMVQRLKDQFDYSVAHGISGICVRVDRDDNSVLDEPNEVNLWTLAMLAGGVTNNVDDIWNAWATNRFGAAAAPGVIKSLKPSHDVLAEALCIGPFTFGDTRKFPYLGDEDLFGSVWQSQYWDKSYQPLVERAERGDPKFTDDVAKTQADALKVADQCLADLEQAKSTLTPEDYQILKTKLLTNKMQLAVRSQMAMAVLHYRRMVSTYDLGIRSQMRQAIGSDLDQVRAVAARQLDDAVEFKYLDRTWDVGPPEEFWRYSIYDWAHSMDLLRNGEDPRNPYHRKRSPWQH